MFSERRDMVTDTRAPERGLCLFIMRVQKWQHVGNAPLGVDLEY